MNKEDYEKIKSRIIEDLYSTVSTIEDSPLMENYRVKNIESYLRSLKLLEGMANKNG